VEKRLFFSIFSLLFFIKIIQAQQEFEGTVSSAEDGMPLPGVNIHNTGSNQRSVTDTNSHFNILASVGDSIIFTFVGMEKVGLLFMGDETGKNISMRPKSIELDELVLIGYSYQKKSVVTGAIASVKSDAIEKTSNLRVEQALQGKVAGVQITSTSGQLSLYEGDHADCIFVCCVSDLAGGFVLLFQKGLCQNARTPV
jgi:hypothetical protein